MKNSARPRKHQPLSLDNYERIHSGKMTKLAMSGHVVSDGLCFAPGPNGLVLKGEVQWRGRLKMHVYKTFHFTGVRGVDPIVETRRYDYHCMDANGKEVVRYDNAHVHSGHQDEHHRHVWKDGEFVPEWVGADGWPTLEDFFKLAEGEAKRIGSWEEEL